MKVRPPVIRWNFAFLSSSGPFERKALPSFDYISPPDLSWPEKVQRDYVPSRHDLLFITIHEVWPGHFLHDIHRKRNVRYLSAIGLHARGMSVEESKAMFLDKGFQDEGNARPQAVRGPFDPEYLNYTLGKLMIRKPREDRKAQEGNKYSLPRFHDTLLSYQCAPVPVIRELMLQP